MSTTSERRRRAACVVGAAVTIVLAFASSACSPDPTSPGFRFHFLNYTGAAVKVTYCDNARCSTADWTEVVAAGQRLPANTSAEGFDEWYRFVRADNSEVVGCRTLNFKHNETNLVVPISSATRCT